jgi:hypothetical protein
MSLSQDPKPPDRVHVIFKTHLDLGFTDLAHCVVEQYFEQFIPQALQLARSLRERVGADRFVWTTGAWLIYEYLEQCDAASRATMERGIEFGDIVWHGLPFTTHTELMNKALFRHGLSLARRLDQRFGRSTIAAKMTDVPGHTRAMIPLLAEAGIRFLHLGVNPASTAPDVPKLFRWRHEAGREILVIMDKEDYGQSTVALPATSALAFAHTRDNEGPPDEEAVGLTFAALRRQFPDADVGASTLDNFANDLLPHWETFPVVTSELGDSWIYGAASDPPRITPYRALLRLYRKWIDEDRLDPLREDLDQFARHLMWIPEHTWGVMVDKLEDRTSYEGRVFEQLRSSSAAQLIERSWEEQRSHLQAAVASLRDPDAVGAARGVVVKSLAKRPSQDDYQPVARRWWTTPHFELAIDDTGAISRLTVPERRSRWATESHCLGRFSFEAFSCADYERFVEQYVTLPGVDWARLAFTKDGMDPSIAHKVWHPQLVECRQRSTPHGRQLLLILTLPKLAIERYGAPRHLTSEILISDDRPEISIDFQWFEKRACRLPTACWLGFAPLVDQPQAWKIEKLGDWISPLDVARQGGRMMHGVDSGVRTEGSDGGLRIESLDAAVVAPGKRSLLEFHNRPLDLSGGMHFCLWNNVWNTNFPYWHERDERFRFRVTVTPAT